MSNQEIKNQSNTKEKSAVDKRRRFIKGAGVAAPVVLTLSSPSIFGDWCLSQMMSGNESHTGKGSCTSRQNLAYWSNPDNMNAWTAARFSYGNLKPKGDTLKCTDYTGGTKFNDSIAFGKGDATGKPMRKLVCSKPTTLNAYLVADLLNASTPGSNYII